MVPREVLASSSPRLQRGAALSHLSRQNSPIIDVRLSIIGEMQQVTVDAALNQVQQGIAANARRTRMKLYIPPLRITAHRQLMHRPPEFGSRTRLPEPAAMLFPEPAILADPYAGGVMPPCSSVHIRRPLVMVTTSCPPPLLKWCADLDSNHTSPSYQPGA